MGYKNLWNPPEDLKADVYNVRASRRKKKKAEKKNLQNKRIREFFLGYFSLHETTSNAAICHMIAQKLNCPEPAQKNQYYRFMKSAYSGLKNDNRKKRKYRSRFKTSDEFYKSKAWKELRYIALKNSDGRCNLCGAMACDGVVLHVDHIKPRSRFPQFELDLDNLQVLCGDCNIGKSNIDDTNWRQHWESL